MDKITLFEEYRLIERSESAVNGAWRGAHLLLFFLAFVFGSFCTFCFHMLMYLFDEKCVLFPKLLSLTGMRHNVIYEFVPNNKDQDLPVDFLSTQWVEKSACSLPTYVPLVSGIFGLVWTTMFLMCSTGSRTLTGLQRPWRVLPPVFLFSLAMGGLCVYSSTITHYGLQELCHKLGEFTGSSTCTYTVNVATLAYERRIRGVYQATRLTILTAWLHTGCWLLSAVLALVRVLMVVDFQLVKINVNLRGNVDRMLQQHEKQIRTISPDSDIWMNDDFDPTASRSSTRVHFKTKSRHSPQRASDLTSDVYVVDKTPNEVLFLSEVRAEKSEWSLVPDERHKLARISACENVPKNYQFIVHLLYDLVRSIGLPRHESVTIRTSSSSSEDKDSALQLTPIARQFGQEKISSKSEVETSLTAREAERLNTEIRRNIQKTLKDRRIQAIDSPDNATIPLEDYGYPSVMDIAEEMKLALQMMDAQVEKVEEKVAKKSNLKAVGVQTDKEKPRVQISETASVFISVPNFDIAMDSDTSGSVRKKYIASTKLNLLGHSDTESDINVRSENKSTGRRDIYTGPPGPSGISWASMPGKEKNVAGMENITRDSIIKDKETEIRQNDFGEVNDTLKMKDNNTQTTKDEKKRSDDETINDKIEAGDSKDNIEKETQTRPKEKQD